MKDGSIRGKFGSTGGEVQMIMMVVSIHGYTTYRSIMSNAKEATDDIVVDDDDEEEDNSNHSTLNKLRNYLPAAYACTNKRVHEQTHPRTNAPTNKRTHEPTRERERERVKKRKEKKRKEKKWQGHGGRREGRT